MDPISYIFSTYIELASGTIAARTREIYGTEIQSISVPYHDYNVSYSYQIWKIKPESVCQPEDPDITTYSKCTVEARNLFQEICAHLQQKPSKQWRYVKNKNMYCTAAMSYKPVIATIEKAKELTPLEEAKNQCNAAIANALGSNDIRLKHEQKSKCAEYQSMMNNKM